MTRPGPQRALLAFVLVFCAPVLAHAQAQSPTKNGFLEKKSGDGVSIVFDDDDVLGPGLDPFADIVKAPPRAVRMNLLRPRHDFVTEMLKSVEAL